MAWEFTDDPSEFLDRGSAILAADPVLGTVPATIAARAVTELVDGVAPPADRPYWYAFWLDAAGDVAGLAMRTAPFVPHPAYLLPLPAGAATALARLLHERGEPIGGVNGSLAEVEEFAGEVRRLQPGIAAEVEHHTRLFRLDDLLEPRPVSGALRPATDDDLDLAFEWFTAFMGDADEQAGRPRGSSAADAGSRDDVRRRLPRTWFWEDGEGRIVHLTSANRPAHGVARIGPVYTPPDQRRRGWASAAVAEVSRRILAEGIVPCLFTDQANPTSNRVYTALGYTPVVDMINLRLPVSQERDRSGHS